MQVFFFFFLLAGGQRLSNQADQMLHRTKSRDLVKWLITRQKKTNRKATNIYTEAADSRKINQSSNTLLLNELYCIFTLDQITYSQIRLLNL